MKRRRKKGGSTSLNQKMEPTTGYFLHDLRYGERQNLLHGDLDRLHDFLQTSSGCGVPVCEEGSILTLSLMHTEFCVKTLHLGTVNACLVWSPPLPPYRCCVELLPLRSGYLIFSDTRNWSSTGSEIRGFLYHLPRSPPQPGRARHLSYLRVRAARGTFKTEPVRVGTKSGARGGWSCGATDMTHMGTNGHARGGPHSKIKQPTWR